MDEWMLNDLLECSVCLERLDTSSKVLPCQHTFCRKCLEEIVSTHKELRCPECRILVELRIDELPPNVLLMRILEGMRNAPKKKAGSNTASSSRPMANMLQQQPQGFVPSQPQTQQQSPGHQHHHRSYLTQHQATREHHSIRTHHSPKQVNVQGVLPNQPCAKAMFNYHSRVHGDLNFKKGDIITLKRKVDANWYEGECGGSCGVFPSSYVQVITPLPSHIPQCKALYDFKMTNDDEEGCLTFKKGEILTVIRRVDENWAEGKLADRIGIFPLAFVELNDIARALVKLSTNSQPGPSRVAPPTPTSEDVTPLIPTDHMITSVPNMISAAPNMIPNPHYSSSFHSTSPSQSTPATTTTTVSSSHASMPLQANQVIGNQTPHHHHQSRHAHHRHHHSQQVVVPQQQVLQTPAGTAAVTPHSSSVSSSTSSSPSSSTSSTPSSSTSASSSTTATNSPNGSSVPSSVPSSPASPPPPPPPPPLPPTLDVSTSSCITASSTTTVEQQPHVHHRSTSSSGQVSPGSSFQLPQQYQREKRHSFNVLHSNQNLPQQSVHRHSAEILSPSGSNLPDHQPEDQNQGQDGQSDCSSSSQSKSSQHKHRRSGSDLASSSSSTPPALSSHPQEQNSSSVILPATYVALYPYKPQKADELELRKGSVYTVTEKCQDGWFKGTSMRTHKCGVFPGNYVALMRPPAPPPPYNHQQGQFNGSSPPAPIPNHGVTASRVPSGTNSPSRPTNHHTPSQSSGSQALSSSRIPIASSVSPSIQSFSRGKSSITGAPVIASSSHAPNVADGRHYGEVAQGSTTPHSGNVIPPKPPRPHSPHQAVNSPHHQTQSLPVTSPPPELPPRSTSPIPYPHHFHPPSSLTTSAPPPVSTSNLLSGNTGGTSSSWHACHPTGHHISGQSSAEGLGNHGTPGGSHNTMSTAVTPPPNVSVARDKKERGGGGVSLMRRLTSMKSKSKSPPLAPSSYSMDNPVFEDGCVTQPLSQNRASGQVLSMAHSTSQHGSPSTHSVHVRSGSCPSQLLQALPPDGNISEPKHHHRLLCSESQRQKHKERPSVVTANLVLFGRSSPSVTSTENGALAIASGGSSVSSGGGHRKSNSLDAGTCLSGGSASGDSGKKSKQLVPQVKERFRCIVAYPPNSEYELELKVGDVIYVHRKREDGWYKGTLQRTGRTGLFPASFVEAF